MSEILVNTIKKADGTGSITVPAETGTVLTSASSIPVANLDSAVGITEADAWRLNANQTGPGLITSNLERVDDASFAKIGTGMTESSGVFSFPSTGLYQVEWHLRLYNSTTTTYGGGDIEVSTDGGSNWDIVVQTFGGIPSGQNGYCGGATLVNVTNTSNVKVRFDFITGSSSTVLQGVTNESNTHFLFTRLGDSQ